MVKKSMRCLVLMAVLALCLAGCSPIVEEPPEQVTVYATFYPIYALADRITRDIPDFELHCLVQPQDECLRSYSLSDWDLYLLLYAANGVLAGGSGLESFSERLEDLSENYFSLAEVFYGLEFYQGMGTEGEDGEGGHFHGGNPHLYLSVDGALRIVESIAASLSVLDVRYADLYDAHLTQAQDELNQLKAEIQKQTLVCNGRKAALMNETLIYPAQDYGMEIACWIERESGEELYGQVLRDAIEQIQTSGAEIILIERQAPLTLVEALEDAGFIVAKLDTLSTHSEQEGSDAYFEALRANAQIAAEACARIES